MKMLRHLLPVALLLSLACNAIAQTASPPAEPSASEPRVTAELTPESVVVGQPLVLRIKVLVPTWLPSPPEFPNLDLPNVIVRLPERASGPVSERVDGETWSGVARSYRLYPMVPGELSLPEQRIVVTYADPGSTEPVTAEVPLPAFTISANLPEAAAGLDPAILASDFTLEQSIEGADGTLGQGDAVVRTVTARIDGTTPLVIPGLIPEVPDGPVQAHTAEPKVAETEERGVLSGSREETVTYVARYGGTVDLPAISVEWFNIDSGEVETAQLEGVTLTIDAPPPPREPRFTGRQVALAGVALALLAGLGWLLVRFALPPVRRAFENRNQARLQSEAHAAGEVRHAIAARDLPAFLAAREAWTRRCPAVPGNPPDALDAAAVAVSSALYGRGAAVAGDGGWRALGAAFEQERKHRLTVHGHRVLIDALPPLNPS
ncbi:hypothetical protein [Tropicimonas aquimaris]|uniref:Oxygen tolerance n=1 Tax=Tropicimonas aquimaris TaxID=914152 RepID=A0ABW3ITH9_9RHOB